MAGTAGSKYGIVKDGILIKKESQPKKRRQLKSMRRILKKKNNKKFLGKSTHRLESNPNEKIFSDAWIEENFGNYSRLQLLLSDDGGKTPAKVTDHDEMIAATVIQWLGSPVGFSWVKKVIQGIEVDEIKCLDKTIKVN